MNHAYVLSTPELTLLTHYVLSDIVDTGTIDTGTIDTGTIDTDTVGTDTTGTDTVVLGKTALPPINLDEAMTSFVQQELYNAGLLLAAPAEDSMSVSGEIGALLQTTLFPERLGMLRLLTQQNVEPREIYFSLRDGFIVCNYLDENKHIFVELFGVDEMAELILTTLQEPDATTPAIAVQPLADVMAETQLAAVLLVVDEPEEPATNVTSLSWLQTDTAIWLVDPNAVQAEHAQAVNSQALQRAIVNLFAT